MEKSRKNIVLIGLPGSGKTTLGRALAQKLGRPFYDADEVLVQREGRSVASLFAVSEECFREAEERTIDFLSRKEGAVIATGGGAVKRPVNMRRLRRGGFVIFLDRPPARIASDVEVRTRPLLARGPGAIFTLCEERLPLYRKYGDAHVVNNGTLGQALRLLVEAAGQSQ